MWGMWGAWGIGGMLVMLGFWVVVIVGIVVAVRALTAPAKEAPRDSALEILRQRYARGEIDKNEFETRKRDLG